MRTALRSHLAGDLASDRIGEEIALCGWVETVRDHGGLIFYHLRDASGRIQAVADPERVSPEVWEAAESLHVEYCVRFVGQIVRRPEGQDRTSLDTKDIELELSGIEVLNRCAELPFKPQLRDRTGEEQRLTYRYLDLRSDEMQRALRLRSSLTREIRGYLDGLDFAEVDTPLLARSTPEGARDFLVPSRLQPRSFYALPQSPQLFKQLLMVGGLERYYQIARCLRDEDLRANRQPEFSQVDIEMSFVDEEDVYQLMNGMVGHLAERLEIDVSHPMPRMPYSEAISLYGTDAPDTRFGMEIVDLTPIFGATEFQVFRRFAETGAIKGICVPPSSKPTRTDIEDIRSYASSSLGAKEPAWGRLLGGSGFESTVAKFWSEEESAQVAQAFGGEEGGLVFFMAGASEAEVCSVLGQLRLFIGERFGLRQAADRFECLWVERFPMFEFDLRADRLKAVHHPFTQPRDLAALGTDDRDALLELEARSYDFVINGEEIGGGSVRIHRPEDQQRVLEILGMSEREIDDQFGFLMHALEFGAPPHGGIALGLDRFAALLAGQASIRDVIAFPKNQAGQCLLTGAPQPVDDEQLEPLQIVTVEEVLA